ncbi:MAG: hypothetical protein L3J70_11845 [Gammaproteobacteria bacterium]|nr:hypothetical protein [Gammaproteobacteria bacterium]
MNKKLIALAVSAAFAAPMAVQADSATVSGFADITLSITDEAADNTGVVSADDHTLTGKNASEGKFGANGEVDFIKTVGAVTARVDVDLSLSPGGSSGAAIEQAFFAWGLTDTVTFIGGVFNNPIGQEAEDAPDKNMTSSSMVYKALDNQTVLSGNNIAGVAVAANLGVVTVTGAVLNDIQHVDEENSIALVINSSPVAGLDLELGYVTQASGVENVLDINASYAIQGATIGFDYLVPDEVLDSVYDVWAGYDFGNNFGAKVRYGACDDAANGATCVAVLGGDKVTTLYGSYQAAENLLISLEWKNNDAAGTKTDSLGAEFIATF